MTNIETGTNDVPATDQPAPDTQPVDTAAAESTPAPQTQAERDAASLELLRAANERDAEPVEEAKPEAEEKKAAVGKKLAIEYRKEKALRKREESLKPREAKVAEVEQILEAVQKDKTKAHEVLGVLGLTLEELVDAEINKMIPGAIDNTPKPPTVEDRIAAIEKERLEQKAAAEKAHQARLDAETKQLWDNHVKATRDTVEQHPDRFPLSNRTKSTSIDAINSLIQEHHYSTKRLMSYEEAAEIYEESLREEAEELAQIIKPAQESSPRSQPAAAKTTQGRPTSDKPKSGQIKTLRNNLTTHSVAVKDPQNMTQEERDAASLAIIRRMNRAN